MLQGSGAENEDLESKAKVGALRYFQSSMRGCLFSQQRFSSSRTNSLYKKIFFSFFLFLKVILYAFYFSSLNTGKQTGDFSFPVKLLFPTY